MNNNITLSVAGVGIKINFTESEDTYGREYFQKKILARFGGFIPKKYIRPEYAINITDALEIEAIHKKGKKSLYFLTIQYEGKNTIRTFYHISMREFSMILRNLVQSVIIRKGSGFLLHASAVAIGGKAVIFTGNSGAGKTTIMTLLSSVYKPLADDSIIIKREKGRYYAYQTPLLAKDYWMRKDYEKYPVSDIYFLKKSKTFSTEKLDDKSVLATDMLGQLLAGNQGKKEEYSGIMRFVKTFDRFGILGFDKNKQKLISFFEDLYENQ